MENSQQSLATESFSYKRSQHHKSPSFDGLDQKNIANNISSDNKKVVLDQETHSNNNFNFDIPAVSSSSDVLVHADEIFSDGYMKPVYNLHRSEIINQASTSVPTSPVSSFSSSRPVSPFLNSRPGSSFSNSRPVSSSTSKNQPGFLKKWRKSSNRFVQKCSGFFKPVWETIGCSGKGVKVDDLGRKFWEVQTWRKSTVAAAIQAAPPSSSSPRQSVAYSAVDWAEMEQVKGRFDVQCGLRRVKSVSNSPQASPMRRSVDVADECQISEAILHCKRSIEK